MMSERYQKDVDAAIAKLRSLHDGDAGVVETVACGEVAIPALRKILFTPEPSGIYETRRHAVEALSSLHALNVLREFLAAPRDISDPVERTGEDAVINAAARALGRAIDIGDLPLFLSLIKTRPLASVIEALGNFCQPRALPYYIDALRDDFLRPSAEQAIRQLGSRALRSLLHAVLDRAPLADEEAAGSVACRRSILKLLEELHPPRWILPSALVSLVDDVDPWIALRGARLCLPLMSEGAAAHAIGRLISHLKSPDPLLAQEIEEILVQRFDLAAPFIAAKDREPSSLLPVWRRTDHTEEILNRVKKRSGLQPLQGSLS